MILGGVLGFAFHLHLMWALIVSAVVLVVAILLAPKWLRQKIIWQKVALLDPQYDEFPADISLEDYKHYFEPIAVTDESGGPADWLKRYIPRSSKQRSRQMQEPAEVEPIRAYPHTDLPAGQASVI